MKALYLKKQVTLINTEPPKPKGQEALIQVSTAGICQTDLELIKGYMHFEGIPGHEFVGKVIESPSDQKWIAKRVVGEINIGCGSCSYCLQGLSRHCPSRSVIGIKNHSGAFAEYIALPLTNLHVIPDSLSDKEAVFVEPLAAACEILEQVHIQPALKIAIIGDGRLAQLIARVLLLAGSDLTVIGKHDDKMMLFQKNNINTCHFQNVKTNKFDLIIEASGSPSGFEEALKLIKPRGKIIIKSTYKYRLDFDLTQIVIDEISLIGSRCGQFEPAIRLLKNKLVLVEDLISHEFNLEQHDEAFKKAADSQSLKTIFTV